MSWQSASINGSSYCRVATAQRFHVSRPSAPRSTGALNFCRIRSNGYSIAWQFSPAAGRSRQRKQCAWTMGLDGAVLNLAASSTDTVPQALHTQALMFGGIAAPSNKPCAVMRERLLLP
jgi:hypothetical protein